MYTTFILQSLNLSLGHKHNGWFLLFSFISWKLQYYLPLFSSCFRKSVHILSFLAFSELSFQTFISSFHFKLSFQAFVSFPYEGFISSLHVKFSSFYLKLSFQVFNSNFHLKFSFKAFVSSSQVFIASFYFRVSFQVIISYFHLKFSFEVFIPSFPSLQSSLYFAFLFIPSCIAKDHPFWGFVFET